MFAGVGAWRGGADDRLLWSAGAWRTRRRQHRKQGRPQTPMARPTAVTFSWSGSILIRNRRLVEDEQIMLEVRGGEVGKLETLFDRHHVPVFRYFLHLTSNRAASEDLVQDV